MTGPGPLDNSRQALQEYMFKSSVAVQRDREMALENWYFSCTKITFFWKVWRLVSRKRA